MILALFLLLRLCREGEEKLELICWEAVAAAWELMEGLENSGYTRPVWLEVAVSDSLPRENSALCSWHPHWMPEMSEELVSVRGMFPRLENGFILLLLQQCCSITNQAERLSWAIAWLEFTPVTNPGGVQKMCGYGTWERAGCLVGLSDLTELFQP